MLDLVISANSSKTNKQQAFIQSLLGKYHKSPINGNKAVQMDKLPEERLPTPAELKVLQCYSGEFNWLATGTRLDLSYYTSLLASSCSKHADWSLDLARETEVPGWS